VRKIVAYFEIVPRLPGVRKTRNNFSRFLGFGILPYEYRIRIS
jgi:hypothetical protein